MLCLAVLLATVAAFGLHPEPADDHPAGLEISQTASVRSGAHLCVACLTHATSLAAPFAAVVLAPADVSRTAPLTALAPPPRLSRTPCSGLSPPSYP
jgi:hypothetical protein